MTIIDKLTTAFLVTLFGFAGLDKIAHYHGFVNAINSYRIIPIPAGALLGPLVIAAELSVALGLMVAAWRRTAALQGAVLMTLLTLGLTINRFYGSKAICGCWFSVTMAQGDIHFLLNGIIIVMSLIIWRSRPQRGTINSRSLGGLPKAGT